MTIDTIESLRGELAVERRRSAALSDQLKQAVVDMTDLKFKFAAALQAAECAWNNTRIIEAARVKAETNAARYQTLRSEARGTLAKNKHVSGDIQVYQWVESTEAVVLKGDKLDAAIDAVRR